MASKTQIISEIEDMVENTKTGLYSLWTIGVTDDLTIRRKQDHNNNKNTKYWHIWSADSESDARIIEVLFIDKGMNGGTGGGGKADYVYIF